MFFKILHGEYKYFKIRDLLVSRRCLGGDPEPLEEGGGPAPRSVGRGVG
eukprot:SAG31_NODE_30405_length_381_cov_1.436170_1_plen_48_part_01